MRCREWDLPFSLEESRKRLKVVSEAASTSAQTVRCRIDATGARLDLPLGARNSFYHVLCRVSLKEISSGTRLTARFRYSLLTWFIVGGPILFVGVLGGLILYVALRQALTGAELLARDTSELQAALWVLGIWLGGALVTVVGVWHSRRQFVLICQFLDRVSAFRG